MSAVNDSDMHGKLIQVEFNQCLHSGTLGYKENEDWLTCKKCGAKLSLHFGIQRILNQESQFQINWARNEVIKREMKKRTRCKCQHCHQFTQVKILGVELKALNLIRQEKGKNNG